MEFISEAVNKSKQAEADRKHNEEVAAISLRDHFACAVMSGILARNLFPNAHDAARHAYRIADAMLAVRSE